MLDLKEDYLLKIGYENARNSPYKGKITQWATKKRVGVAGTRVDAEEHCLGEEYRGCHVGATLRTKIIEENRKFPSLSAHRGGSWGSRGQRRDSGIREAKDKAAGP